MPKNVMLEFSIESSNDPRLDPYRDLKQPRSPARETFIAEGEKLVVRLLESPCRIASILCNEAARDKLRDRIAPDVPIYVASTALISGLVGFRFHRGILACGFRPPARNLESLWPNDAVPPRSLIVLCPDLRDPTNLGTIIRTAAAFGADGLVAGHAGTDPYSRRVLRTSMGTVLRLPIVQTDDWAAVLDALHRREFETVAAVLDPAAESLVAARRPARVALLLGNEAEGLPDGLIGLCRHRITLPMAGDVDSLNVAVAAGIMLYHFANGL